MFYKKKEMFNNYAKFFCLDESYGGKHNWVNKNGQVLNLLDNQPLDNWDFNKSEVLPTADNWWIFYRNIMDRLEARNKQIEELLREKCSEGELQELYSSLDFEKD